VIAYRGETERVNFYSECRNVLLLELAGNVTLDEGGLEMALSIHNAKLELCIAVTLPVPPSPTSTSLKVGMPDAAASAMVVCAT
jgi:hypothetical protein